MLNWISLETGPSRVVSPLGSPTVALAAAARAISVASAMRDSGTSIRVGALQDWPLLPKQPMTPPLTALAKSAASSRMILADFPPSSWVTRLMPSAALRATSRPARVEPVKETTSISGCEEIAAPTVGPSPLTRLKTPAGKPDSAMISASRYALTGAISLGLRTMAQPAAIAGATLQAIWFKGQFQGVMKPQTPAGSLTMRELPRSSSN